MGMLVPNCVEEEEEPVIFDAEPEVEPKDVVKEEEDKPCAKAYYHFNNKLATAPKAVQEEVSKIKALPHRSGKQCKLQQMATALFSKVCMKPQVVQEHCRTVDAQVTAKTGQGIPQARHGDQMWC